MAYSCARWRRNRGRGSLPALLFSVTVVAVSQVAWALPRAAAYAAESPPADPSEPRAQSQGPAEPTATPRNGGTRADSGDDQDLAPRRYLVAFGGALATGPAGLTGGFGTIEEGYVRASVLPSLGLGIGVSYLDLSVSNSDNYPSQHAQALELNASWHPLKYLLDPFLQLGELRLFNVSSLPWQGGLVPYLSPSSPWSTEGRLGVNLAVPHFAIGLQVRAGLAHYGWLMAGFQLEGRI